MKAGTILALSLLLVAAVFVFDAYGSAPANGWNGGTTTITSPTTFTSVSTRVVSGTVTTITQSGTTITKTTGGTTLTSSVMATKTLTSTSTITSTATSVQTIVQTSSVTLSGTATVVKTSTIISSGPTQTATITFTVIGTTAAPGLYTLADGVLYVLVYHVVNYGSSQQITPQLGANVTVQQGMPCYDIVCRQPDGSPTYIYSTGTSALTAGPDFNGAYGATFSGIPPYTPLIITVQGPVGTVGGVHSVWMGGIGGKVDTFLLQESSALASVIKLGVVGTAIGMSSPSQEIVVVIVLIAAAGAILYLDRDGGDDKPA